MFSDLQWSRHRKDDVQIPPPPCDVVPEPSAEQAGAVQLSQGDYKLLRPHHKSSPASQVRLGDSEQSDKLLTISDASR